MRICLNFGLNISNFGTLLFLIFKVRETLIDTTFPYRENCDSGLWI